VTERQALPAVSWNGAVPQERYQELVRRIQEAAGAALPPGATVLVVSKGDEELLRLRGCRAWHFPRDGQGNYAGHHPADGAAALAHLEAVRAQGADYFLLPATALWWLDHYKPLKDYLAAHCQRVLGDRDTCLLWKLGGPSGPARDGFEKDSTMPDHLVAQVRELVAALLPAGVTVLVVSQGKEEMLRLGACRAWHFPRDDGGGSTGHYPADGAAAVAHLEALRAQGADYLLLPATALWWLDRYEEVRQHLDARCRLIADQQHVGMIYDLGGSMPRHRRKWAPARAWERT
jgi:hypothetical protein